MECTIVKHPEYVVMQLGYQLIHFLLIQLTILAYHYCCYLKVVYDHLKLAAYIYVQPDIFLFSIFLSFFSLVFMALGSH